MNLGNNILSKESLSQIKRHEYTKEELEQMAKDTAHIEKYRINVFDNMGLPAIVFLTYGIPAAFILYLIFRKKKR